MLTFQTPPPKRVHTVVKKQRVFRPKEKKEQELPTTLPEIATKKTGSWIYGPDDDEQPEIEKEKSEGLYIITII